MRALKIEKDESDVRMQKAQGNSLRFGIPRGDPDYRIAK
jgi:hypothetical protein